MRLERGIAKIIAPAWGVSFDLQVMQIPPMSEWGERGLTLIGTLIGHADYWNNSCSLELQVYHYNHAGTDPEINQGVAGSCSIQLESFIYHKCSLVRG